jgi:hypothetical protein
VEAKVSINWKHPLWRWFLVGAALGAVGWFVVTRLLPSNPPGPTPSERTADSLAATKPAEQALIDSSNARIASRGAISGRANLAARIAQERASQAKRRADSLAIAREWEGAYIARTEEADSLRSVTVSDATTILNLKADTTDLRQQLGIIRPRLAKTEAVVVGLRKDLDNARKCKILGLIQCPSRIQTAALTLVTYVAVDHYRSK